MIYTPLSDSDLLLVIDMCNEGMEKCESRVVDGSYSGNPRAAAWNRQMRERYARLKADLMRELESRSMAGQPPKAQQPSVHTNPDTDASK